MSQHSSKNDAGGGLSPWAAAGIATGVLGLSALLGQRNAPILRIPALDAGIAGSTSPASRLQT